jgi:CO/xanthine dehydrogenase Mo-binding subunit
MSSGRFEGGVWYVCDCQSGAITVKRVVAAQDMGIVINPEGARVQMEGCITMGLSLG